MQFSALKKLPFEGMVLFSFFSLLGIYASYPLIKYLTVALPYVLLPAQNAELLPLVPGDHLQVYYWFWLLKDNFFGLSHLFTNPYEFNIAGNPISQGYVQFPYSLLFIPLSVFGNITAHNLLVLLSFPFSGLAMFYLLRCWVSSRSAALVGAVFFSLAPARQAQLFSGHINAQVYFLLPLFLLLFEKGFRQARPGLIVLAGICLLSLGPVEPHLVYYFSLFLAVYLPARFLGEAFKSIPSRGGEQTGGSTRLWPLLLTILLGIISGWLIYQVRFSLHQETRFGIQGWYAVGLMTFLFVWSWLFLSHLIQLLTGDPLSKIQGREALLLLIFFLLFGVAFWGGQGLSPRGRQGLLLLVAVGMVPIHFLFFFFRKEGVGLARLQRIPWKKISWTLGVFLFFLGLAAGYSLLRKAHLLDASIVGQGRAWGELTLFSPHLTELLQRVNFRTEGHIYPGLIPLLLLAILAIALWRKSAQLDPPFLLRAHFFFGLLLISFCLALGPSLHPILPLYKFLFDHFPFFDYPRSSGRIIVITVLCLSILSAFSWELLSRFLPWKSGRGRGLFRGLTLLVTLFMAWDYHPQKQIGLCLVDEKNQIYSALAELPRGKTLVLGLPLFPGDSHQSSLYEYYITLSRQPMVNGYSPVVSKKYVDSVFWPLLNINMGEIGGKEYALLRRFGVTHLVHHQETYFFKVSPFTGFLAFKNLAESPYLKLIWTDKTQSLFALLPEDQVKPQPPRFNQEGTGIVYVAEELRREVGEVVQDPDGFLGKAVRAKAGKETVGLLSQTPMQFFPSGKYRALFRLKSGNLSGNREALRLEVTAGRDPRVIYSRVLKGSDFKDPSRYERIPLDFEIDQPAFLQFRLFSMGQETIWNDRIVVAFAGQDSPNYSYEAEEGLRYLVRAVPDPAASGGWALKTNPSLEHPGVVCYGPYKTFEKGNYTAVFRLKLEDPARSGPIARLDVTGQRGSKVFQKMEIRDTSFSHRNAYQEFRLPFSLEEDEELEFRVYSYNRAPFRIDRINVIRDFDGRAATPNPPDSGDPGKSISRRPPGRQR